MNNITFLAVLLLSILAGCKAEQVSINAREQVENADQTSLEQPLAKPVEEPAEKDAEEAKKDSEEQNKSGEDDPPTSEEEEAPEETPDPTNDLTFSNLQISGIVDDGFAASVDFSGDENTNAVVELHYCNESVDPSCDPEDPAKGTSVAMIRGAAQYAQTISGLTSPINPGHILNIRVTAGDADGVHGTALDSTVNLTGGPTQLVVTTEPTDTAESAAMSSVVVEIRDAANSLASYSTQSVTVELIDTSDGFAALSGTLTKNAVAGVVQFDDLSIDFDTANYLLKFTSEGLTETMSTPFNITQAGVTEIFRSVGSATGAITVNGGDEMTITSGVATFENPLPDNVGVGDAIQYSKAGGGIDRIMFIHQRKSSTTYVIRAADGSVPIGTDEVTANTSWMIYRAYDSMINAEDGQENDLLDDTVEDFELFSGNADIRSGFLGAKYSFAAYGDATESAATMVNIYWETDADHYLRVYTPVWPSEVGVSQRHTGKWDSPGSYVRSSATGDHFYSYTQYMYVIGLRMMGSGDQTNTSAMFTWTDPVETYFLSNIVLTETPTATSLFGVFHASGYLLAENNVFSGYKNTGGAAMVVYGASPTGKFDHNTIFDSLDGIQLTNDGSVSASYNVVQQCTTGFNDNSGAGSFSGNYNITNSAGDQVPGANSIVSTAVSFEDSANGDFRLATNDAVATDAAVGSTVKFDVDGQKRTGTNDIGADEKDE